MLKFLMCPPEFYDAAYETSTRRNYKHHINFSLAKIQWELLYKLLNDQIGVHIELIKPIKGLSAAVFTANGGLVSGQTVFKSNFRNKERQPESLFFADWFKERGYDVIALPKAYFFEGEADVVITGPYILCGYHQKTDLQAYVQISEALGKTLIPLELKDERFYHLNSGFCYLNKDSALLYPHAFEPNSLKFLKNVIKNVITVTLEEALNGCCSSIVIGKKLIMPSLCQRTIQMMKLLGYQVFEVDISEYTKAGNGLRSLVLTLEN
jgi:N-dimethylarginine dimethylaminohydrolase